MDLEEARFELETVAMRFSMGCSTLKELELAARAFYQATFSEGVVFGTDSEETVSDVAFYDPTKKAA
jgi:hypothetical protein